MTQTGVTHIDKQCTLIKTLKAYTMTTSQITELFLQGNTIVLHTFKHTIICNAKYMTKECFVNVFNEALSNGMINGKIISN